MIQSSTWTKIAKLHDDYKDQLKKRNMTNKKSFEGRKRYEKNLNKLFRTLTWRENSLRTELEGREGGSLRIYNSSRIREAQER